MFHNKEEGRATPTWSLPFLTQYHLPQVVPHGGCCLITTATTSNAIATLDTIVWFKSTVPPLRAKHLLALHHHDRFLGNPVCARSLIVTEEFEVYVQHIFIRYYTVVCLSRLGNTYYLRVETSLFVPFRLYTASQQRTMRMTSPAIPDELEATFRWASFS